MKNVICLLSVFLVFAPFGVSAESNILNQIPDQIKLIFKAEGRRVYVTPYGKKYHTADCSYTNITSYMSARMARAEGYVPCAHCIPQTFRIGL